MATSFPLLKVALAASLICLFLAAFSEVAVAQSPPIGPEGNWEVDWIGSTYEHTPDSVRISLYQERENPCKDLEIKGCVFGNTVAPTGDWSIKVFDGGESVGVQNFSVDRASGNISIHHYYHVFDYWGGIENAQMTGPDTIQGDWTGNDEAGKTRWTRIVPKFVALEVHNVGEWTHVSAFESSSSNHIEITMPWTVDHWHGDQNFPNQRPQFILQVVGINLWGHHIASVPGSKGIEVRHIANEANADGDGALSIEIKLWPGVRPGRHTLYLDGQAIEIDLKIPGFPEDPNDISIGPLQFSGLTKLYHPKTEDLTFLGLQSTRHVEIESVKFAGLINVRHVAVGGFQFVGYGETNRIALQEQLVFKGWRADLAPISTKTLHFSGWAAPETVKTDLVTFEGWRWEPALISTETLKFRGHGGN